MLIIDDVATTGATLRNAATALRSKGCERVIGATVARTLLKSPSPPSEKAEERGVAPTPRSQGAARTGNLRAAHRHPGPKRYLRAPARRRGREPRLGAPPARAGSVIRPAGKSPGGRADLPRFARRTPADGRSPGSYTASS
ncbi:MAG: hypothetical protein HYU28_04640 [Actinobacteria bacterium]|nr:hypothetical protein [Actinomycetota bacterium]